MSISRSRSARLAGAFLLLISASSARAGSLTPNPANGTSPATAGWDSVSLIPNPASYQTSCSWLSAAANNPNEPYYTPTNKWNFSYAANFNGTYNLTTYAATIAGPANAATSGGANFSISYTPGAGDPTGNNVRWMQVIEVNQIGWNYIQNQVGFANNTGFPQAGYTVTGNGTNGVPTGSYAFLDNAGFGPGNGAKPTDPWYGWLTSNGTDITTSTAANSTGFSDTPSLAFIPGMVVQFQTFLAQDNVTTNMGVTTNNVTIYGGVWWGFQDAAPEPSSWILLLTGCGVTAFVRRRTILNRLATKKESENVD